MPKQNKNGSYWTKFNVARIDKALEALGEKVERPTKNSRKTCLNMKLSFEIVHF